MDWVGAVEAQDGTQGSFLEVWVPAKMAQVVVIWAALENVDVQKGDTRPACLLNLASKMGWQGQFLSPLHVHKKLRC